LSDTAKTVDQLIGIAYQGDISEKKTVAFQAHVPVSGTQKDIDAILDKCRKGIDRQKKFAQIEAALVDIANLEAQIAATGSEIDNNDRAYAAKAAADQGVGRRGEYHGMTKEQENMRLQQVGRVDEMRKSIVLLTHRLTELRIEVGDFDERLKQAAE
jgi:hypothetical protein